VDGDVHFHPYALFLINLRSILYHMYDMLLLPSFFLPRAKGRRVERSAMQSIKPCKEWLEIGGRGLMVPVVVLCPTPYLSQHRDLVQNTEIIARVGIHG